MDNTTAPKPAKNKKYVLVRYGLMNTLGWFEHPESTPVKQSGCVVVVTERGLELGNICSPNKGKQFKMSIEQVEKYFLDSQIEFVSQPAGKIVRYATAADINEGKHLRKIVKEEIAHCKNLVKEMNLPMKIIDADHVLGGERIIFYFMSETRIDFRQLVKNIAQGYQTRIEMRQIGPRDEAKLLGDFESCGQECCCKRFLKSLKPVNMRMAKMQKATLDPTKISGYCGRLKCCLRYEDLAYTELKNRLPKKGITIKTPQGEGRIIDTQILTQLVMVEHMDGKKSVLTIEEFEKANPELAVADCYRRQDPSCCQPAENDDDSYAQDDDQDDDNDKIPDTGPEYK